MVFGLCAVLGAACNRHPIVQDASGGPVVEGLQLRLEMAGSGDSQTLTLSIWNRSSQAVTLLRDRWQGTPSSPYPAFAEVSAQVKPPLYEPGVQTLAASGQPFIDKYVLNPGQAYTWTLEITRRTLHTGSQYLQFIQDGDYELVMKASARVEGRSDARLTSNPVKLHFGGAAGAMRPAEARITFIDPKGRQATLNVGSEEGVQVSDIYSLPGKADCNNWLVVRVEDHSSIAVIEKIATPLGMLQIDPCEKAPLPRSGSRVIYSAQKSKG